MVELIVSVLLALVVGGVSGFVLRLKIHEKSINHSKSVAEGIINEANANADKIKKNAEETSKKIIYEGKQEVNAFKKEAELDLKERRQIIVDLENKLSQREDMLERRTHNLDKKEENLITKESKIDEIKEEIEKKNLYAEEVVKKQELKLHEIANLSLEEARDIIMTKVKDDLSIEITSYIKEEEEKAKLTVHNKAKSLLSLAIQKYASETTTEKTVSVVDLPSDEMKGRIIGREGRNIRTIEALTGVDLIVDDTPEAVVLSGFDPIRREIAKRTLQSLVNDGRIHPGRIEELVDRSRLEVEMYIRECGEEAVFTTGIGKLHPDLVKLLGRLNYRTSYGQNVLKHSIETSFLAGKLAAEIGENELLARRAGLLHDIGKAVDHEIEGSHVEIGYNLCLKYRENPVVLDAIASHHGDKEAETIIAILVAAADALSSSRPGARSDSLENYVKRLEALEQISNNVPGVETSFAIQAGREIRVMVKPEEIDDLAAFTVARKIKEEIENKLSYPGTIKVTVIRETRAVDVAK